MEVPMSSPDITEEEIAAVNAVLRTPFLSIGPQINAFEQAIADRVGARYAVGVNSGTSGLHLCVIAAGVEEHDLVITTSFSFVASANCILYERGVPIFVDIDPATGNIDPQGVVHAVEDLLAGGSRAKRWLPPALPGSGTKPGKIKAILPVHAFGQPADMDPIISIAKAHGIPIIEDACEAIGAEYKGRQVGTLGDVGTFAFYPNKQMTTGEGGIIVTDREEWAELFRSLRNQGRDVFDAWLNHTRLGYNYRLDEMSAALGIAQAQRLDELLEKRARVAGWYNERIGEIEGVEKPYIASTTTRMSWFVYVIHCSEGVDRNELMAYLRNQGVPSRPYFTPIHLQPFYQHKYGWKRGDLPHTEKAGDTFLAIPFSGVMTEEQVDYVCQHLSAGVAKLTSRVLAAH
jgi:perosamine synthetase